VNWVNAETNWRVGLYIYIRLGRIKSMIARDDPRRYCVHCTVCIVRSLGRLHARTLEESNMDQKMLDTHN